MATSSNTELSEEIQVLESIYEGSLTVKAHCVTVHLADENATLTFLTSDRYPTEAPRIEVTCSDITLPKVARVVAQITKNLNHEAQQHKGSQMIFQLIESFKALAVDLQNARQAEAAAKESATSPGPSRKDTTSPKASALKQSSQKLSPASSKKKIAEEESTKKAPMRTATDVVDRIRWDDTLPGGFIVGYEDRFIGIVEKKFDEFNWQDDLGSLSHEEVAIPRHRIVYFKYRSLIVWDKRFRLDNVFGSQGGKLIMQVVEEYDAQHPREEAVRQEAEDEDEDQDEDDQDDDDEDGEAPARAGQRKTGDANRPNFFICFHVNDPNIRQHAQRVQDSVVKFERRLAATCIPTLALHVTLLTLRIVNEEQLVIAKRILAEFQPTMNQVIAPGRAIHFKGVNIFRDRVLYGEVTHGHTQLLGRLVDELKRAFTAGGVKLIGNHGQFTPHMTLVKMSRQLCRELHHIPQGAYLPIQETTFGDQPFEGIHLCRMSADKDDTGFYARLASLPNVYPAFPRADFVTRLSSKLSPTVGEGTNQIVIVRGLSGSGKSSLVSMLQAGIKTKFTVCSADFFFQQQDGSYLRSASGISQAHDSCRKAFREAVSSRVPCILIDNTNSQRREYEGYVEEAKQAGYEVTIVEIQCGSRARAEEFHRRNSHQVNLDAVMAMFERWEFDNAAVFIDSWRPSSQDASSSKVQKQVLPTPAPKLSTPKKASPHAMKVIYTGIFLTSESKATLLARFPAQHHSATCDHVTLCYNPDFPIIASLDIGMQCSLRVLEVFHDEFAQCVSVEIAPANLQSMNEQAHITISYSEGAEAVYSNELMKKVKGIPCSDLILTGHVGLVMAPISDPSHSICITERAEFIKRSLGLVTSNSIVSSSLGSFDSGDEVHTVHIFDFDGTLCDTQDRDEAIWEYQRLTGRVWPHRDFFTRPESLEAPLTFGPGPALPAFRQFCGRRGTKTIILSGRTENTRSALTNVIAELDAFPDELILKPTPEEDSAQFKLTAIKKILASTPSIKDVKIWEDDKDAIAKMMELGLSFKSDRNITLRVADAGELGDTINTSLRTEKSSLKTWLKRSGLLPSEEYKSAARQGLHLISECWKNCLLASGIILQESEHDQLLNVFGSFPFGRRSDLDVCLIAPNSKSVWEWIQAISQELRNHGVYFLYAAASDRCPRLKIRLYFTKCSPVEFDLVVSSIPSNAFVSFSKGQIDMAQLEHLLQDTTAKVPLSGPIFLQRALAVFDSKNISNSDVACMIEFTKRLLSTANLNGNSFHGIRTFHLVSIIVDFSLVIPPLAQFPRNLDVIFSEFLVYCAKLSHQDWVRLFGVFVPHQFIAPLMAFFQRSVELTSALLTNSNLETARFSYETIKELFRRPVFPMTGFSEVVILSHHDDDVMDWQLGTFVKARAPTYIRRLMDQFQVTAVLPFSASENTSGILRFAVLSLSDIAVTLSHCFSDFWKELSTYETSGAQIAATIDGHDFFAAESVADLLIKDIEPVLLQTIINFMSDADQDILELPSLTSLQRLAIHNYAELNDMGHTSEGSGASRRLILSKTK